MFTINIESIQFYMSKKVIESNQLTLRKGGVQVYIYLTGGNACKKNIKY